MNSITPCLWFDNQAEEAALFYTSVFPNSSIGQISRYDESGPGEAGSVAVIEFTLDGTPFTALNGGPIFQFTPAVSFMVPCETQAEVDRLWNRLTEGGEEEQCGWLKDRYGVSWQIIPTLLSRLMSDPDPVKVARVNRAMLQMVKLDCAGLQRAYDGAE